MINGVFVRATSKQGACQMLFIAWIAHLYSNPFNRYFQVLSGTGLDLLNKERCCSYANGSIF
jgi:uncharacterized membrane protein YphA (DoxX/SURF4 family)